MITNTYLYHYTNEDLLGYLLLEKRISENILTNSRIKSNPFVWLTTSPTTEGLGLKMGGKNSPVIKITVKGQNHYERWKTWYVRNGIEKDEIIDLEHGRNPDTWFISEKEVSPSDIIKIENIKTGIVYYTQQNGVNEEAWNKWTDEDINEYI